MACAAVDDAAAFEAAAEEARELYEHVVASERRVAGLRRQWEALTAAHTGVGQHEPLLKRARIEAKENGGKEKKEEALLAEQRRLLVSDRPRLVAYTDYGGDDPDAIAPSDSCDVSESLTALFLANPSRGEVAAAGGWAERVRAALRRWLAEQAPVCEAPRDGGPLTTEPSELLLPAPSGLMSPEATQSFETSFPPSPPVRALESPTGDVDMVAGFTPSAASPTSGAQDAPPPLDFATASRFLRDVTQQVLSGEQRGECRERLEAGMQEGAWMTPDQLIDAMTAALTHAAHSDPGVLCRFRKAFSGADASDAPRPGEAPVPATPTSSGEGTAPLHSLLDLAAATRTDGDAATAPPSEAMPGVPVGSAGADLAMVWAGAPEDVAAALRGAEVFAMYTRGTRPAEMEHQDDFIPFPDAEAAAAPAPATSSTTPLAERYCEHLQARCTVAGGQGGAGGYRSYICTMALSAAGGARAHDFVRGAGKLLRGSGAGFEVKDGALAAYEEALLKHVQAERETWRGVAVAAYTQQGEQQRRSLAQIKVAAKKSGKAPQCREARRLPALLADDTFCKGFLVNQQAHGVPLLAGAYATLEIYERFAVSAAAGAVCPHDEANFFRQYAAALKGRGGGAWLAPHLLGAVERGQLRCLAEAMRVLAKALRGAAQHRKAAGAAAKQRNGRLCRCGATEHGTMELFYDMALESALLYVRLGAAGQAVQLLWGLLHHTSDHLLRPPQAVNLGMVCMGILAGAGPRSSLDLPPSALRVGLRIPPELSVLGGAGKQLVAEWHRRVTAAAGFDQVLHHQIGVAREQFLRFHVGQLLRAPQGRSQGNRPASALAERFQEVRAVVERQKPIGPLLENELLVVPPEVGWFRAAFESAGATEAPADAPLLPTGPVGSGDVREWLLHALALLAAGELALADAAFTAAQADVRTAPARVTLAANHAALRLHLRASVAPALYPLHRLPTARTSMLLSAIRTDPACLARLAPEEQARLLPPALRAVAGCDGADVPADVSSIMCCYH